MGFQTEASQALDSTLAVIGNRVTHTGTGTTAVSWWLSSEAGILIGIVIGVAGLAMNWYYSRKRDRREEAEHALRMVLRKDSVDHE